jgi:hypothetical protein
VLTLGCSRKSVRLLTFRSNSRIWAELHEHAFRRLGGATRIVVLDNLREGVLVPDIYDPVLNPLYRDVLAHYGAVAMPCRIQDPDRRQERSGRRSLIWPNTSCWNLTGRRSFRQPEEPDYQERCNDPDQPKHAMSLGDRISGHTTRAGGL